MADKLDWNRTWIHGTISTIGSDYNTTFIFSYDRIKSTIYYCSTSSKVLQSPPWLGWPFWNICVTNDHAFVPLVVSNFRSFSHSWIITGFVTRLTRHISLEEQELLTLPEHLSSPPVFRFVLLGLYFYMYVVSIVVCPFVLFLLAIVLSVLGYTDSDYPFGIFKLL